jgi:hypothetical protein
LRNKNIFEKDLEKGIYYIIEKVVLFDKVSEYIGSIPIKLALKFIAQW